MIKRKLHLSVLVSAAILVACGEQNSQQALQSQQMANFNPAVCDAVSIYFTNDDVGLLLAHDSYNECIKTQGQIGPAYQRWKDHYYAEQSRRATLMTMPYPPLRGY